MQLVINALKGGHTDRQTLINEQTKAISRNWGVCQPTAPRFTISKNQARYDHDHLHNGNYDHNHNSDHDHDHNHNGDHDHDHYNNGDHDHVHLNNGDYDHNHNGDHDHNHNGFVILK